MSRVRYDLTDEQEAVKEAVLSGNNVLVDACIGSGKTTLLEEIYRENSGRNILYLTYNTLLKVEAQNRLPKHPNVRVKTTITNFNGFVAPYLHYAGIQSSRTECVSDFIKAYKAGKIHMAKNKWHLLLIDEYQDIDEQRAFILDCIKETNPTVQVVAVGDMAQKIYDSTKLDVYTWIINYLGTYVRVDLTTCFRLSKDHAAMLGRVWGKDITGVNEACEVKTVTYKQALKLVSKIAPKDLLCLGSKTGADISAFVNDIETLYPTVYNKETVFVQIKDGELAGDTSESAVFATFDSSKGMERKYCFVFDFTKQYWKSRANQSGQRYAILRNIFCVGASRGKQAIYFVKGPTLLSEKLIRQPFDLKEFCGAFPMSAMFEHKYKELCDVCYDLITREKIETLNTEPIEVTVSDGHIDLTPCIGHYQEMSYFSNYDYKSVWDTVEQTQIKKELSKRVLTDLAVTDTTKVLKIQTLMMTALDTKKLRYIAQVDRDFMPLASEIKLHTRLEELVPRDSEVQVTCQIDFGEFKAIGRCDVLLDDAVYELKFVNELQQDHFLQCACYMVALNRTSGILWNTRDNTRYKLTIADVAKFKKAVKSAVTNGML